MAAGGAKVPSPATAFTTISYVTTPAEDKLTFNLKFWVLTGTLAPQSSYEHVVVSFKEDITAMLVEPITPNATISV